MPFDQFLQWLDLQHDDMTKTLQQWAAINTGSYNVPGLRHFARKLEPHLQRLGAEVATLPLPAHAIINDRGQPELRPLGDVLRVRSPQRHGPHVLLAIHTDTVYGPEHAFQEVTPMDNGTLRGPGVCDAKGG